MLQTPPIFFGSFHKFIWCLKVWCIGEKDETVSRR